MSKEIFKEHLVKTIKELTTDETERKTQKFRITAIHEVNKKLNSTDDMARLWLLSDKNIKGRSMTMDQVIDLFSGLSPLFPIWINVSIERIEDGCITFELETSMRFRKPTLLHNQETEHPPFKAVIYKKY